MCVIWCFHFHASRGCESKNFEMLISCKSDDEVKVPSEDIHIFEIFEAYFLSLKALQLVNILLQVPRRYIKLRSVTKNGFL